MISFSINYATMLALIDLELLFYTLMGQAVRAVNSVHTYVYIFFYSGKTGAQEVGAF